MASYPRMLGQLADPRRFPALTAFIAAGVFDAADGPDDEFVFGLDRILDGVGVLIGGLPPATTAPPETGSCPARHSSAGAEQHGCRNHAAGTTT